MENKLIWCHFLHGNQVTILGNAYEDLESIHRSGAFCVTKFNWGAFRVALTVSDLGIDHCKLEGWLFPSGQRLRRWERIHVLEVTGCKYVNTSILPPTRCSHFHGPFNQKVKEDICRADLPIYLQREFDRIFIPRLRGRWNLGGHRQNKACLRLDWNVFSLRSHFRWTRSSISRSSRSW